MKHFVLLLALFLVACSRKEEYTLSVSTDFNERQTQLIIAAVSELERACGIYVQVSVEDVNPLSTNVIYPATKNIDQSAEAYHYPFINKILILKDEATPDPFFYTVVLHELGHWLGGIHTENELDVMFPSTPTEVWYKQLTYNDLESICPWR